MVAGQGFKDFVVGEVLTSSDVDGFLMQQSVMRFADDGARGSALGTAVGTGVPLAEGMVAYLDDVNQVQVYDGVRWKSVGGLVAVKSAIFAGTQSGSLGSRANFAVTDLTITHALADASNKLIISAFVGATGNDREAFGVGIAIHDGTDLIAIGEDVASKTRVTAASQRVVLNNSTPLSVSFVHSPGDTTSRTYTVRVINVDTSTNTLFVNRLADDSSSRFAVRSVSSLVIQEVKV